MSTYLSTFFTLEEATNSQTASRYNIDNSHPPESVLEAATKTAKHMDDVRKLLGCAINVDSWIRCLELNRKLGSKDSSQHIKGEAVDFISPAFGSPAKICLKLLEYKPFILWDQLILEHTWVHISWNSLPNAVQRGQVLSLLSTGDYAIGLTTSAGQPISS